MFKTHRPTHRLAMTWLILAVLSLATTGLTTVSGTRTVPNAVALAVLLLAGLKAHLILRDYLSLGASPFWMRALDFSIALFLALAFALFALAD